MLKAFEFAENFKNRRVQILCSYWMTDVLELHRELLKTDNRQFCWFWSPAIRLPVNNSILKSGQHSAHHILKPASGNLASFGKLSAHLKAFGTKRLRTYYFSIKSNILIKNYEYLLTKAYQTIPLVSQSLYWVTILNNIPIIKKCYHIK